MLPVFYGGACPTLRLLYGEVAADDEAAGLIRRQGDAQVVEVGGLVVAARVEVQVEFVAVAVHPPV